jgi:GNAT superfamily N-acetyltransferase
LNKIYIHSYTGSNSLRFADALAELRIAVFREWPYLYEGSLDYERRYLQKYADCPDSVVVIAQEGERFVGASTALPLAAADTDFKEAFAGSDYAIEDIFYLGESVLRPEYRGRGVGHRFFDEREAQARAFGARYTAFCAVDRVAEDPRRPKDARALDNFWIKRGYTKHPEIKATFDWREIGQSLESNHTLTFWIKEI